jgi:hypothetical protein
MKLIVVAIAAAVAGASTSPIQVNEQPTTNLKAGECVSNYDAAKGYDFFPDKFTPSNADHFTVDYKLTYKVITVTHGTGQTVVAYQCGTPKPTVPAADLYVSVPVTKVAITSSTYIPWIELLGERATIKHYTSSFLFVSSPCLKKLHSDGSITTGSFMDTATVKQQKIKTAIDSVHTDIDNTLNSVTFANTGSTDYRAMQMTDTAEDEVLETAEYVGLISFFYNQEAKATAVFSSIKTRYTCVKDNVETMKAASKTDSAKKEAKKYTVGANINSKDYQQYDSTPPKVLWVSYAKPSSGTLDGWSVGTCPNYYCEVIADAGGKMIEYLPDVPASVTLWMFKGYHSDAELLSKATDADYVIFTGGYSLAIENNKTEPVFDKIKAFKETTPSHPRIFYTDGLGGNDWFESRIAEPDVLLEDIVTAIWPTSWSSATMTAHTPVWVVPVTQAAGNRGTCTDVKAPLKLQADACADLTPDSALAVIVKNSAFSAGTAGRLRTACVVGSIVTGLITFVL